MNLQDLLEKIKSYTNDPDLDIVGRAYEFARKAHEGQFRDSGEPFFNHPVEVAEILAELELDVITIAAALLHDVVEDTDITIEQIEEEFGKEIALLVNGVTKLSQIAFKSREEHQAENLRKMFLAMAKDIRVILIKLADRLHNMRTLNYTAPEKQKRKAEETLEIYAPLAHRLGMFKIKWELEDLSFRYLEPKKYYDLARKVATTRKEREKNIERAIRTIKEKIESETNIKVEIYGRPKHLYSIYQKMLRQKKEFSEIYDLTAIRIIVNTVRECYEVLGIVHELWKPIPGRFKDYIAMPKSNMYQSLHTTVIGPKGDPLEIQIRTWDMHRIAEYGIAAHWRYKEGKKDIEEFDRKLSWLRQLLEWQKDLQDASEFMENLKIDLFEDEVFVFTPKGDVVSLPCHATPVDFAFFIHTEIGMSCVGAKVNGKIVPLEYKLENGDIVEIITSKNSTGPSRDWLKFVKTSKARSKIKRWFKRLKQEEVTERGKQALEEELKRHRADLKSLEKSGELEKAANRLGYQRVEDLLEAIGYNKVTPTQVAVKLGLVQTKETVLDKLTQKRPIRRKSVSKGVRVEGVDDLFVRLSRCCNPVPGDEIIGYVTRGRGVSVHRKDCPNVKTLLKEKERCVNVSWDIDRIETYQVELELEAMNQCSLLNNITSVISEAKVNITAINARTNRDGTAKINISLEISSLEHMNDIIKRLRCIDGILDVRRANPT
ncbi:(p)ppGpp synthetase [Anoxybacter fermentans]|uniref:GTP diphosphokinase n=1 Tax=Anoxybacter fermentans TaxID=1323375 RepID=A0A3Q9HQF8_9FIRM|nr:bifunctional (p)ppGpp synthetase/guanosine-3',5'-bis(diphosphate) 3'-pyrophosphohydrolase [Anoxybacter fermentans]AZR73091.1 (p)ppGpp synthetase [Anoxybacter fermentans]